MRMRVSYLVLRAQPLFLLLPTVVLLLVSMGLVVSIGLGWTLLTKILITSAVCETYVAVRRFGRKRAGVAEAAAGGDPTALLLTRAEHPAIWQVVDGIAVAAGALPPERIVLSMGTIAAVGPFPGQCGPGTGTHADRAYELVLSPTFLAEAQMPQLLAVLGHEVGHVASGSLNAQAPHHRLAIHWTLPVYEALPTGLLKMGAWLHLRCWRPVKAWANRPEERIADDVAFRLAGPRTAAAALAWVERLDLAETVAFSRYMRLAVRAGVRGSIIEAVHGVLTAPDGSAMDHVAPARTGALDWVQATHPTTAERIATAQRAALEGRGTQADARSAISGHLPAAELLTGGSAWLVEHELALYGTTHPLAGAPTGDWPSIVDRGWRLSLGDAAHSLAETVTSPVDKWGDIVPRGGEVKAPVDARPEQVTARVFLEAADRLGVGLMVNKPDLPPEEHWYILSMVSARALDSAGRLRVPDTWAMPRQPEYFDGLHWQPLHGVAEVYPDAQAVLSPVDAAVIEIVTGQAPPASLMSVLADAGADLDAPIGLSAQERADRPGRFLGAHSAVSIHRGEEQVGDRWCAVLTTTGLWLVPEPRLDKVGWLDADVRDADQEDVQKDLMKRVARDFDFAGRAHAGAYPGSIWVPESDVVEFRLVGTLRPSLELIGADGPIMSLRLPSTAPTLGKLLETALAENEAARTVGV